MRKILAAALCLIGVAAVMAQDNGGDLQTSSAEYVAWSKAKIGDEFLYEKRTKADDGKETVVPVLVTLDSREKDHVRLSEEEGTATPSTQPVILRIETIQKIPRSNKYSAQTQTGAENITMMGRTYKCKIFEREERNSQDKLKIKTWVCDDFPAYRIKEERTLNNQDGESTITIIAVPMKRLEELGIANPMYVTFSKWPVGTKLTYDNNGRYDKSIFKGMETYITLTELTDEYARVKEGNQLGSEPEQTCPEKIRKNCVALTSELIEFASATTKEDLTIGGETYKCKVLTIKQEGTSNITKLWLCPDVPGYLVKRTIESVHKNGVTSITTKVLKSIEKGTGAALSQPAASSAPANTPAKK